jgi:hypothetical protein
MATIIRVSMLALILGLAAACADETDDEAEMARLMAEQ